MKTSNTKKWNAPVMCFIVFLVLICAIFLQYLYLAIFPSIYGIDMNNFSSKRNTYASTLYSKRGTIYDSTGNTLAIDVSSYTVIAYLDESRTGSSKKLYHVADKQKTAESLAPLLNMSIESLMILLNKDSYQVELGPGGRNITEITKTKIEELNLPGISFVESYKRYYPNGDFASYIIGYAKRNEVVDDGKTETIIQGELGIEANFDEILKGINGYTKYQQDRYGYKIPDTKEEKKEAVNGMDIYLTLNANIQRIVEASVKNTKEKYTPEWITLNVMDAKTGDILASSSTPSYDPNILNITNYEDPLTSFVFEPGSVMKIFTYMCAMEKGTYKGDETYNSGHILVEDTTIYDWNKIGWGSITFDKGFQLSSNVGVVNLVQNKINQTDLKTCLEKYGFGKKTDINLPREMTGSVVFNYPVEVAAAAYGQGISTTPIQILQALSIIANNGKMVKPNIISKMIDGKGNMVEERKINMSENIVSENTIKSIKELMFNTVNSSNNTTGKAYKVEGLDIIGKTGTAEVYDPKTGTYSTEWNNKIYSFTGMFPKEDPQIIVFASIKKPNNGSSESLSKMTQPVMESIGKYLGLINNSTANTINKITIPSYISSNKEETLKKLKEQNIETIVLGTGDVIIDQYPKQNTTILNSDKVYLLTSGEIKMPNFINYSRIDAIVILQLLKKEYQIDGYGFVKTQNIKENELINDKIVLTLEPKHKIE